MSEKNSGLAVVVIGLNQARSLEGCFRSIKNLRMDHPFELIYVDSGSIDNSIKKAKEADARVICIDPAFRSAAAARNAGWKAARAPYVFFLDGDTVVDPFFVEKAWKAFDNPHVAVICGHRREMHPEASIYQRVLDVDWIYPTGIVDSCGGDAIMRKAALEQVGGYDVSLQAGEEPEMCSRMRALGWLIERLDLPMTLHDLEIHSFAKYWKRCFRTGCAYAEVARKTKNSLFPLWEKESLHNLWKGSLLLLFAVISLGFAAYSLVPLAIFLSLIALATFKTALSARKKGFGWKTSLYYGLHSHFQHIPMFFGQLFSTGFPRRILSR